MCGAPLAIYVWDGGILRGCGVRCAWEPLGLRPAPGGGGGGVMRQFGMNETHEEAAR